MAKKKSIAQTSIFGEYKKPEDRVTAALLHIIHIGGNMVVKTLFGDVFDIPSNDIHVIPQSYRKNSIPDGELSCECNYHLYIESKIVSNSIDLTQLANHKKLVNNASGQYLIYLTPDQSKPAALGGVEWMDWKIIIERLQGIVADGIADNLLKYLIEQFILLIDHIVYQNKYYTIPKDESVIIVGGHFGEQIALKYNFYACQANRKFRPSKYLAFYHQHRIKFLFEIVSQNDSVDIRTAVPGINKTNYFTVIEPNYSPQSRMLFQLKLVKTFSPEIKNDKTDKNGKLTAFVQGQTYTTYDKIMNTDKTSGL